MSSYHEAVKRMLNEVNKFLNTTLKSESLTTSAQKEKNKLVELLRKLYADYDTLVVDEGSTSSAVSANKDPGSTDDSLNKAEGSVSSADDSSNYADNIPISTVKALQDSIKAGYLERKQKGILSKWQKCYCVVHKNVFYCYKKPEDSKQQFAFFMTGYEVREAPQLAKGAQKDGSFELVCPGKKTYHFVATGKDDLKAWEEAVEKASKYQPTENGGTAGDGGDIIEDDIYEEFNEGAGPGPGVSPAFTVTPASPTSGAVEDADDLYTDAATPSVDMNQNVKEDLPPPPPPDDEVDDDLIYEPVDGVNSPPSLLPAPPQPLRSAAATPKSPDNSSTSGSFTKFPLPPSTSPTTTSASTPPPLPSREKDGSDSGSFLPPLPARDKDKDSGSGGSAGGSGGGGGPPPLPDRGLPLPPPPTTPLPPPPAAPLPPIPHPGKKMVTPQLAKIQQPAEDFENMFYGLFTCSGSSDNELSFKRGQIIHVISRDLDVDSWWVGELEGKIGLVPKGYLSPAYELVH